MEKNIITNFKDRFRFFKVTMPVVAFSSGALISFLFFSCTPEKGRGAEVVFNPFYQDDFYSFPFPNDFRKKPDGKIDMAGYPIPEEIYPVGLYPSYAEKVLTGFGNNTPVYFTFTEAIDTSTLPESPLQSLSDSSTLLIINIDKNCKEYGIRVPLIWDFQSEENQYIKKIHSCSHHYGDFLLKAAVNMR